MPVCDFESVRTDLRNGETVSECRMHRDSRRFVRFERRGKTGDVFCFDRDDLCFRPQSFHRKRNTGEQPRAADWDDDCVDVGNLFDDLKTHRTLAGDDSRIVVAVDVSEPFVLRDLVSPTFRFGKIFAVQHDIRAELLAIVYFNERREFRHDHRRRNAE